MTSGHADQAFTAEVVPTEAPAETSSGTTNYCTPATILCCCMITRGRSCHEKQQLLLELGPVPPTCNRVVPPASCSTSQRHDAEYLATFELLYAATTRNWQQRRRGHHGVLRQVSAWDSDHVTWSRLGVSRILATNSSNAWLTATFAFALVSTNSVPPYGRVALVRTD